MIRAGFLTPEDRKDLIALARDGAAEHRLARRANAVVLLNDGWSCQQVAQVLFVDDDTVRTWFRLYQEHGTDGLVFWIRRLIPGWNSSSVCESRTQTKS